MNWLQTVTIVLHVLIAAAIVGLVLLQRGKGADAGAGFGAGASGTVFGARGSASFLSRTTAILAALFMVTSLSLAYLGGRRGAVPTSVIDRVQQPASTDTNLPALPSDQSNQAVEKPAAPAQNPAPQAAPTEQTPKQ